MRRGSTCARRIRAVGFAIVLGLAGAALAPTTVFAADPAALSLQRDERRALALLDRAVKHVKTTGAGGLADFSRQGPFVDRELYVFAMSSQGELLASGGSSAALIGRDVREQPDAVGKRFMREVLETATAKGEGRVEYRWLNPVDNRVETKVTLFRKVGDIIVAVGYYSPRATPAQAQALLTRAIDELKSHPATALADFQTLGGRFMEDDLYVFVIDLADGRFLAHGGNPELVGRDGTEVRDAKGKAITLDMINIAKRKGMGELDYVWRNPTTGKAESKHSFFRAVDGRLVGVGYYAR